MKAKKKAKGRHKPDWPKMFADRIVDLENRLDALERAMWPGEPPSGSERPAPAEPTGGLERMGQVGS